MREQRTGAGQLHTSRYLPCRVGEITQVVLGDADVNIPPVDVKECDVRQHPVVQVLRLQPEFVIGKGLSTYTRWVTRLTAQWAARLKPGRSPSIEHHRRCESVLGEGAPAGRGFRHVPGVVKRRSVPSTVGHR